MLSKINVAKNLACIRNQKVYKKKSSIEYRGTKELLTLPCCVVTRGLRQADEAQLSLQQKTVKIRFNIMTKDYSEVRIMFRSSADVKWYSTMDFLY